MSTHSFRLTKPQVTDCHYCGRTISGTEITIDHIIPKIKGGTDERSNLLWCCKLCNVCKSDSDYERFLFRLKVIPISKLIDLNDEKGCKKYQGWWARSVNKIEKLTIGYEPRVKEALSV